MHIGEKVGWHTEEPLGKTHREEGDIEGDTLMPDSPFELDLRGLKCPMPVLRTRKALRRLAPGDALKIFCSDPLAVIDIPHMVREDGHRLLESISGVDGSSTHVIVKRSTITHREQS